MKEFRVDFGQLRNEQRCFSAQNFRIIALLCLGLSTALEEMRGVWGAVGGRGKEGRQEKLPT